jgi:PAS domain S-box-containing protein
MGIFIDQHRSLSIRGTAVDKKKGIGRALIWLVLVGILPIAVFSVGMGWLLLEKQKADERTELTGITRALQVAVDRELENHVAAMRLLVNEYRQGKSDLHHFYDRMRHELADHSAWLAVGLINPVSHIVESGTFAHLAYIPMTVAPTAVDDAVGSKRPIIVGAFSKGNILDRPMILLMAPVIRDDEVHSVMVVVVDPASVSSIFAEQRLPQSWTGAVIDKGMRLAGRSRNAEQYVGLQATPSLSERILTAESGLFEAFNQEGEKVYTAFSRSPVTGWSVALGIPVQEVEAPIYHMMMVIAASGGSVIILGLVFAGIVGRAIIRGRRAHEAALWESREQYRLLVEGVRDHAIIQISPDGLVETWTQAAERIGGYKAEEVLGRHVACFYLPEDIVAGLPDQILAIAQRDGRCVDNGWKVKRDGSRFWLEAVITALRDNMGLFKGFAMIARDVTDQKMMEVNLKRINAELEQFAYVVSHDLREPLRMVSGYLGLIEKRMGSDLADDIKTYLAAAVDGAKHMDRLISGVLQYSRIGYASESVLVPLGEVVANVLRNLTAAIREADADISVADSLPTIAGDPTELVRLFQNLLSNAIKYRSPDRLPSVEIGWHNRVNDYLIWVKDNGIGIAPADRERAFLIFQRLVPEDAYDGTGIGLAICKKIILRHGGKIWIESILGKGSVFFMTFPAGPRGPTKTLGSKVPG